MIDNICIKDMKLVFEDGTELNCDDVSISEEDMTIDTDSYTEDNKTIHRFNSEPITLTLESCYINKKVLFLDIYGYSNNYCRLHGGLAVREHTRRNYLKRNKRKIK